MYKQLPAKYLLALEKASDEKKAREQQEEERVNLEEFLNKKIEELLSEEEKKELKKVVEERKGGVASYDPWYIRKFFGLVRLYKEAYNALPSALAK